VHCRGISNGPRGIQKKAASLAKKTKTAGLVFDRSVVLNIKEGESPMHIATKILAVAALAGLAGAALAGNHPKDFAGYWMGTDPLDGGDTRRGITINDDGETLSMAGRDSYVSSCAGNPERAFLSFDDGEINNDGQLVADGATIQCFPPANTTPINADVTYELLDKGVMTETATVYLPEPPGTVTLPPTVFFRVSNK
jgi:hypothetical protein